MSSMLRDLDWTAWTAIATLVLAGATLILAVLVVFGEWIRGLIFRPDLEIEIDNSAKYVWSNKNWLTGEPVQDAIVWSPPPPPPMAPPRPGEPVPHAGAPAQHGLYWVRFGIRNRPGWRSVGGRDIEVFVSDIKTVGASQKSSFVGFNLKWALQENIVQMGILPGVTKYCDLGRVWHPSGRTRFKPYSRSYSESEHRTIFEFAAFPQPRNFSWLLEPERYELTLQVGGKNARMKSYPLTLRFPDEWRENEDEMREAISVGLASGATVSS
jgi:hypothetical protein